MTPASQSQNGDQPSSDESPVSMPLVFQPLPPDAKLSEAQIQAINDLRQEFVDKIGGLNQSPDDPAYLKRWQQAQPEADEMLRGWFGSKFYISLKMSQGAW